MSVTIDQMFGCRLWPHVDKAGYGRRGPKLAHIAAFEEAFGLVPEGFELDHMCRRRNCVALHHLEAVTRAENEKRKSWRYRARRATCPQGHGLASNRAITPEGGVVCRACNREANHG